MITRPGTLEFAKYVIVFTTRSSGSTADVLRLYRMRWRIELVFKRLKSLAQLGHVPSMTTAVPALGFMENCLSRFWHKN
jgi:Transposase DDE domain